MVFSLQKHPLDEVLVRRFRIHNGFHAGQKEIIAQLVRGKRVLAIQRTGWGKSLCYQLASCYYPFLTLVFSPLKALMRDQCQRCNDLYQIPAGIVSSAALPEENARTLERAVNGELKILYIAPERLDNHTWQESVQQMRISMVVIDEAHCISTWGHDFRPHYRRIFRLLQILPENLPVLALTATANARVEKDILQQIGQQSLVIRGSMQRPNLRPAVVNLRGDQEKLSYLAANIAAWQGSGIIYTSTKHSAEMTATFLQQLGIDAEYYHAGRDELVRQEIEQGLMNNRYKVVCSTNALGMGIDKPDLRFLIHYHIPSSPIQYYQEIGRAGRNGPFAEELVLKAVEVVREHYPLAMIDGIVSVPPTVSGTLVEDFARRVALQLELPYLSVLAKQRVTREQKVSTNSVQKQENVKGAFVALKTWPEDGPVLLLIDDIYDSGYMMHEVGATLMQAGAHAVYPLTITRTLHSDDQ